MNYTAPELMGQLPQFTSAELVVIITALGAFFTIVIGAIGSAVVAILVAWKKQMNDIATKAEVIVGHVNSEKTAGQGRELLLQNENKLLKDMVEEGKRTAALLAQAASHPPSGIQPAPIAHVSEVVVVNTPKQPIPVDPTTHKP